MFWNNGHTHSLSAAIYGHSQGKKSLRRLRDARRQISNFWKRRPGLQSLLRTPTVGRNSHHRLPTPNFFRNSYSFFHKWLRQLGADCVCVCKHRVGVHFKCREKRGDEKRERESKNVSHRCRTIYGHTPSRRRIENMTLRVESLDSNTFDYNLSSIAISWKYMHYRGAITNKEKSVATIRHL